MNTTGMTMSHAITEGQTMLDLLKRQHQLFLDLQKLSQEQRALIKAQQSEDLLHLLAKRQKIVDAIGQVHRQSAPYRDGWPKLKDMLPESLRTDIGKLLNQLQEMLNVIIEQDREDCQELSASKQQVSTELNQNHQARTTNAYYNQPGASTDNPSSGSNFQITG